MRNNQIQEVIRKGSISYEYRDQQKGASALTAAICGIAIGVILLGTAFVRGCSTGPAVADCLCEGCGEVIAETDHGQCLSMEVASCE